MTSITDPTVWFESPTRHSPTAMWRRMPLASQMATVGMLVLIAWFVTADAAADRQELREAERMAELSRMHDAELIVGRLGTSIETMLASYRGFIISGNEALLAPYPVAERTFRADTDGLLDAASHAGLGGADILKVRSQVLQWQEEIVRPNIAARRREGLRAFEEGEAASDRIIVGIAIMDEARAALRNVGSDIREEVRKVEAQLEEAVALDYIERLGIIAAALLIFMLLGVLILRVVSRALHQVVGAAQALNAGAYADARLPMSHLAPNMELASLASTFDTVAAAIATRERQMQDDIVRLRELERVKSDFVSTVSHELRTPLTSMRGALGLMLGGKAGEIPGRGRDLLNIAMMNTERLIRLINDILDIDKIDAGQGTVRHDRLVFAPLLEVTVAGLEALARETDVKLQLTGVTRPVEAPESIEVIGDGDRLIQVFTNLVANAIKFSPAGATVDISMRSTLDMIIVEVRDRGPGIPEEFRSRIFGRFQQAGGAESRKSGGTGLGLNIARGIVELHGGAIGFEPAPDGGTIFRVTLPRAQAITSEWGARQAVLVVEDDKLMRDVLVAQIESFARPIAVSTAEEALKVLESEPIEVLILDSGLPGMDGFEFSAFVRAHPKYKRTHIFLYSAEEHAPAKLVQAGIRATDAYVKSRDSDAVMFDRLRAVLRTRR